MPASAIAPQTTRRGTLAQFFPNIPAAVISNLNLGTVTATQDGRLKRITASRTAEEVFGDFSTALSAPGATYYVATTGNDSNDGLTEGAAFKNINKAVQAANTAGVPTKVLVKTGSYNRTSGFIGSSGAIKPAVDIAFCAYDGRVVVDSSDNSVTWAADVTYTNTYSATIANALQVIDYAGEIDQWGLKPRLRNLATPAQVNVVPNSWTLSGGKVYVRRSDALAPTTSNTKVLRQIEGVAVIDANVNAYYGSLDGSELQLEGGGNTGGADQGGGLLVYPTAPGVTKKIVVAKNVRSLYGHRGFAQYNQHGYMVLFDCFAGGTNEDAFNVHNVGAAGPVGLLLTINCTGAIVGAEGHGTSNVWTSHEDCYIAALGGRGFMSQGGMIRSVGTSFTHVYGVSLEFDRGDIHISGSTVPPTLFRIDAGSFGWAEDLKFDGCDGSIAIEAIGTVYVRNCPTGRFRTKGAILSW